MRLGGSIEMLGFWIFFFLLGALSRLELCKMLNGNFIRPGELGIQQLFKLFYPLLRYWRFLIFLLILKVVLIGGSESGIVKDDIR